MKRIFALSIAIILTMLCGCTKNNATDSSSSLTSNTFTSTEASSENKETEKVEKKDNFDAYVSVDDSIKNNNNNSNDTSTSSVYEKFVTPSFSENKKANNKSSTESGFDKIWDEFVYVPTLDDEDEDQYTPPLWNGYWGKYVDVPSPEDYRTSAIFDIPTITESNKYDSPYSALKVETKTTYYGYEGFFFVGDFWYAEGWIELSANALALKAKDYISLSDFSYAGITVPDDEIEYFVVTSEFVGNGGGYILAFFAFIGTQEDKENLCNNIKNGLGTLSIPVRFYGPDGKHFNYTEHYIDFPND